MLLTNARALKSCGAVAGCAVLALWVVYGENSAAQTTKQLAPASGTSVSTGNASPIYGVTVPPGYRDWKLIAVKHPTVGDKADQLRAQLGNEIAIKAFREGTIPFPDGSMIAALHWTRVLSDKDTKVIDGQFPEAQSFIIGAPVNVQFMVKDSKKYAATGGWGFADFTNGMPGDRKLHEACFPCHGPAKDHDFVFTRYASTP